jgi:Flp pilus assembly protein TadD
MIGIVQVGEQAMADRYMYLPLIGPAVMFVWGTADLAAAVRSRRGTTAVRVAGVAAMTAMLVALALRARDQVGYWRDSVTLFEHTLAVTADNYNAHLNLGLALTERGELERAVDQLTEVTRLRPDLASGYYNLGIALDRLGRVDEAETAFRTAIDRDPTDAPAYNNLGRVLASRGRLGEADARLEQATRLDPDFAEAYYNRGTVLAMQRDWSAAERLLARAVELRPDYAIAHYNHALVLDRLGREQDARGAFARAERYGYRGPRSPPPEAGR